MPKLTWIDLETTGLDPEEDDIVEVAVGVADFARPFEIETMLHWVIRTEPGDWERVDPFVRNMHEKSGLLRESLLSSISLIDVVQSLARLVPVAKGDDRPILAGSTVHFDRSFLKVVAPHVESRFIHRHYDVSSMKLFAESLGMPRIAKAEAHRAVADVRESVEHARQVARWFASPWNTGNVT